MLTLWVIFGVAALVLVGAAGYLVFKREKPKPDAWSKPRHDQPWDERPDEERPALTTVPPPAGVPIHATESEELSVVTASQDLWFDDEPTGPVAKIVVRAAGGTHPGRRREHNEDAYLVLPEHEVYAIADGMGGYAAGEVASQLAVDTLRSVFESGDFGEIEEGFPARGAELAAAIRKSNALVRAEAYGDESKTGMGTTIVSARFSPGRRRVYLCHVGDSRCYRLREGELKQLTTDHTLEALGISGPGASKLSRAVGVFDDVEVDITVDEPAFDDQYLLCSDGLYKMLSDEEIRDIVATPATLDETVQSLIDAANERGGRDNVTVVIVRIDEPDFDPEESGEHRLPG